jgi:hypothetical protein
MSAAAILSVAARKAASEGKKVGAAALTLIALVVMSFTAFPGLNRAPADQMAEAPASSGSTQDSSSQATPSPEATSGETNDVATDSQASDSQTPGASSPSQGAGAVSTPKPTPSKPSKDPVQQVLEGPSLGSIMNADASSRIFVLDKQYTAVGDNGLTAKFTFNPSSAAVFTGVNVEFKLEDMVFDFIPANATLIAGKNEVGEEVYLYVGQAPFLFDEYGTKWSETEAKNATFKLEVIMESNGISVKEIKLALYRAPSL